jgi:nicotinamide-nucleotide amidase
MVCFGIARRAGSGIVTRAVTRVFEGDREAVRLSSVHHALQMALEDLRKARA